MAKKILTAVITVLLLAGILFGICYYVGWRANRADRKFEVKYDGKVVDNLTGLAASVAEPLTFAVHGNDYTVRIIPAKDVSLTYTVGGEAHNFADAGDLTAGFVINATSSGEVTVTPRGSLRTILSLVHGDEVTVSDNADMDQDLFTVVFEQDGKDFSASFGLYTYSVNGVTLPEGLVF